MISSIVTGMNKPTKSAQNKWLVSDLDQEDRTTTRRELTDGTGIVRYVRLSTLFHYLSGRAFIPSLRLLQNLDPLENLLAKEVYLPAYGSHHLKDLLTEHQDWLRGQARGPKVVPKAGQELNAFELRFLAQVWLDELARRRSIWCWNIFEGHSNALWSLYGSRGVAIHSTVGHVKKALGKIGPFRCLIAAVRYPIARRMFYQHENPLPTQKMIQGLNLFRPYLFKDRAYRYEEEVRFVFGTHPDLVYEEKTMIKSKKGILIEVDGKTLVQGVSVAPEIPPDEAELIADTYSNIQSEKLPRPQYPSKRAEEWAMQFVAVGGTPFTMEDAPPGLFPDLDL
jgi:hypothetical protein